MEVWEKLESAKIASACIQAHRIAKRVIDAGGDNGFLGGGRAFGRIFIHWVGCGQA